MAQVWASPTEPKPLRGAVDHVSMYPEDYGGDVLVQGLVRSVVVQRKTIEDLVSSVGDGRLAEQVAKMQKADFPVIVIEGPMDWTASGHLITNGWGQEIDKNRWIRLGMSIAQAGVMIFYTRDLKETIEFVEVVARWSDAEDHSSLAPRGSKVGGRWGEKRKHHYQEAMLTTLPGVGNTLARAIIDEVGFPFTLKDGLEDVHGLGPKKLEAIKEVVE